MTYSSPQTLHHGHHTVSHNTLHLMDTLQFYTEFTVWTLHACTQTLHCRTVSHRLYTAGIAVELQTPDCFSHTVHCRHQLCSTLQTIRFYTALVLWIPYDSTMPLHCRHCMVLHRLCLVHTIIMMIYSHISVHDISVYLLCCTQLIRESSSTVISDPGLKSGTCAHEQSPLLKKKVHAGHDSLNHSP